MTKVSHLAVRRKHPVVRSVRNQPVAMKTKAVVTRLVARKLPLLPARKKVAHPVVLKNVLMSVQADPTITTAAEVFRKAGLAVLPTVAAVSVPAAVEAPAVVGIPAVAAAPVETAVKAAVAAVAAEAGTNTASVN